MSGSIRTIPISNTNKIGAAVSSERQGGFPILELPQIYHTAYVVFFIMYSLIVAAFAFENMGFVAVASGLLNIFAIAFPILFYRRGMGFENPLVISCILATVALVSKRTLGLIYGLPIHAGLSGYSPQRLEDVYAYGNLMTSLSFFATYVGFNFGQQFASFRLTTLGHNKGKALFIVLTMTAVSLISLVILASASGGIIQHIAGTARGFRGLEVEGGAFYRPLIMLVNFSVFAGVLCLTSRQAPFISICVCGIAMVVAYVADGRRSSAILPLILFLLTNAIATRRIPAIRVVLFGAGAVAFLGLALIFREANFGSRSSLNTDILRSVTVSDAFGRATSEMAARSGSHSPLYAIVARVPGEVDHLYGAGYLRWFNLFIPRFIWPDKPRGIDVETAEVFFGAKGWGMPPGTVGQAFWEFNVFGVIGVFFVVGIMKRVFFESLRSNPLSYITLALYILLIFYFEPDQNNFRNLVFLFLPCLLTFRILGMLKFGR